MAKINRCLRFTFIIFNGLFAGIGCMLLYGTVKATTFSTQFSSVGGPSMGYAWAFSIGILGISCLGIYAGKTEKVILLKIFAGFMGVGLIIMIIIGIMTAVAKNQFMEAFNTGLAHAKDIMQDRSMRDTLEELQLNGHCCGINHPSDWDDSIPESCDCNYKTEGLEAFGLGRSQCEAKPSGSSGPSQVYSRPCSEVIVWAINILFKIAMGMCFGFAALALFGLLISLLMIHQVRRYEEVGGIRIPMKGF